MEVEDREVENQVRRLTKETVVSGKRVEVGKLASRSILATVLEERSVHEEKEHRHGRTPKESDNPVTLQDRINEKDGMMTIDTAMHRWAQQQRETISP